MVLYEIYEESKRTAPHLPIPHAVKICSNMFLAEYKKSSSHTFVLLARLNSFHVVMLRLLFHYEKLFLNFINSPRVINFDSAARYLFICFMSNVNLSCSRPVIIVENDY